MFSGKKIKALEEIVKSQEVEIALLRETVAERENASHNADKLVHNATEHVKAIEDQLSDLHGAVEAAGINPDALVKLHKIEKSGDVGIIKQTISLYFNITLFAKSKFMDLKVEEVEKIMSRHMPDQLKAKEKGSELDRQKEAGIYMVRIMNLMRFSK